MQSNTFLDDIPKCQKVELIEQPKRKELQNIQDLEREKNHYGKLTTTDNNNSNR